jgi:hypothetical protein
VIVSAFCLFTSDWRIAHFPLTRFPPFCDKRPIRPVPLVEQSGSQLSDSAPFFVCTSLTCGIGRRELHVVSPRFTAGAVNSGSPQIHSGPLSQPFLFND